MPQKSTAEKALIQAISHVSAATTLDPHKR
jgi:hypothetical protein